MTHKRISIVKSIVRIGGLGISLLTNLWQIGVIFLITAEMLGIYEEKYEDTIPVKS